MIEMLQRVDEDGSLKNGEEKVIESEEEELQERLSGIDIGMLLIVITTPI